MAETTRTLTPALEGACNKRAGSGDVDGSGTYTEIGIVARQLGNLGDFLPDKEIRCRVRGCTNIWTLDGHRALAGAATDMPDVPDRMCEQCFTHFKSVQDRTVPCANPDCDRTWTWTRYQQVESKAQGYASPPPRFCEQCQERSADIADRNMPCRQSGCSNTWLWTSRQQMTWKGTSPPRRFCESCYRRLKQLQDRDIPCRMNSCQGAWTWNRYQQLQHEKDGKSLDAPPRRMCESCYQKLRTLEDLELPCKVPECSRTWTFTAYAQLEGILKNGGAEAEAGERMCPECYRFYAAHRDAARRCRNRGCSHTWVYTRHEQLRDWLHGRHAPPSRMCGKCVERRQAIEDRAIECSVPGCSGTWAYSADDQLKDECAGRREPLPRRCHACETFLGEHQAASIPCGRCSEPIGWSPYEQLLTSLGTFVKPEICAACAEKELAERTRPQAAPPSHHHIVRMPAGGKWGADPRIAAWPTHLDYRSIEMAEKADLRIVAFGDDLTHSSDTRETAWPAVLEEKLNQALADEGLTVAVVNAGIPGTNSAQALKRLPRDVAPFAPHLVVFSFAFGDSLLRLRADGTWREDMPLEQAMQAVDNLCRHLKRLDCRLLYWTTNPQFPHDRQARDENAAEVSAWAREQQARKNRILAHSLHACATHDIPVIDLRSRFEVNGRKSAMKWMSDWYRHNTAGAQNIATWMANTILQESLLPFDVTVGG